MLVHMLLSLACGQSLRRPHTTVAAGLARPVPPGSDRPGALSFQRNRAGATRNFKGTGTRARLPGPLRRRQNQPRPRAPASPSPAHPESGPVEVDVVPSGIEHRDHGELKDAGVAELSVGGRVYRCKPLSSVIPPRSSVAQGGTHGCSNQRRARPRYPPSMNEIARYARALWEWTGSRRLLAAVTYAIGWTGLATVGVVVILFTLIWEAREVADDAPCAKCLHRKDDHHGNCQACLRDELHGALTREVPCSRFARGSGEPVSNA